MSSPRRLMVPRLWRPLVLAASLAVVAVGSWRLALQHAAGETLTDDVLASHIRWRAQMNSGLHALEPAVPFALGARGPTARLARTPPTAV